jgi:hypothetical protein
LPNSIRILFEDSSLRIFGDQKEARQGEHEYSKLARPRVEKEELQAKILQAKPEKFSDVSERECHAHIRPQLKRRWRDASNFRLVIKKEDILTVSVFHS